MSNRFAWLLGVVVLVSISVLVACGTKYKTSSDGLMVVASQGSEVIQSFSFSLGNGHIASISNPPVTSGQPSAMVLDPAGAFAYTIVDHSTITAFPVNSDGTIGAAGSSAPAPNGVALAMDAAGKFLFVAEGLGGGVSVYAISGGTLTAVPGTFTFPATAQTPNFVALAATPTVFPTTTAVCSTMGNNPPSSQFLYVADAANNVVWEFLVDPSGELKNPPGFSEVQPHPTDSVPSGVAVDPCDRFVYVANIQSNRIDAFTICNGLTSQSTTCPTDPDGTLVLIAGSPFSLSAGANGPGPLAVDPFGNFVYVVDTLSNQVSGFRISSATGSLTALNPAVVATGSQPKAIAIRSDDNWLFVSNYASATVSQYAITPASGALSPLPAISTDNYPWGVAVK